jgi:2-polyprenyl-3-methyl-5-hydroxy-6-metoxy-1,4-benzoquinol methylase
MQGSDFAAAPPPGPRSAGAVLPKRSPRIGVFIVAYNAASTIESVLRRIKPETWERISEVFIFDDCSQDDTCSRASSHKQACKLDKVKIYHNQVNLGYGGNQRRGYRYAIENGFDIVVLLHGDGQYAPEVMDDLLEPLVKGEAEAVFGSRMMQRGHARKGGMPLYKYLGNKVLTGVQNLVARVKLSEYHSGYRAYNVHALAQLPLGKNSTNFHFDTEIIYQLHQAGFRIKEVPIPTYYGDEICRVNGMAYAWNVFRTTLRYRLHNLGVAYAPQFDVKGGNKYVYKHNRYSSHKQILRMIGKRSGRSLDILDLGCGPGHLARRLQERGHRVVGVDGYDNPEARQVCTEYVNSNIEDACGIPAGRQFDRIILADILEHTRNPEAILLRALDHLKPGGKVIASTGNVAHAFIRLSLLLGRFTYTERGILDRTHCRLFTWSSFIELFRESGYRVLRRRPCPIPFELVFHGKRRLAGICSFLNMVAARLWPGLCAYQTVLEAEPAAKPTERMREHFIRSGLYAEWGANRAA